MEVLFAGVIWNWEGFGNPYYDYDTVRSSDMRLTGMQPASTQVKASERRKTF